MAINSLGDALAKGGGTYAQDDDPELVRDASAFGLKTIETLLDAEPEHKGLHLAASRNFTQYAFAFLQAEADYIEEDNYKQAAHMRKRAKRMYVRARRYGLRGLGLYADLKDFEGGLKKAPTKTLAKLDEEAVPLLYWTAATWAAAVGIDKDDASLAASLDLVEALIKRGIELDPDHGAGALYDFLLSWDGGRPAAGGGSVERARQHMEASLKISGGKRVAPLVSFAEIVSVKTKKPAEFDQLLDRALAFDVDSAPQYRIANLIAQKRARWLKSIKEDLFLE
jgi:predicted anti-sigma-YlaC factor YlaD